MVVNQALHLELMWAARVVVTAATLGELTVAQLMVAPAMEPVATNIQLGTAACAILRMASVVKRVTPMGAIPSKAMSAPHWIPVMRHGAICLQGPNIHGTTVWPLVPSAINLVKVPQV